MLWTQLFSSFIKFFKPIQVRATAWWVSNGIEKLLYLKYNYVYDHIARSCPYGHARGNIIVKSNFKLAKVQFLVCYIVQIKILQGKIVCNCSVSYVNKIWIYFVILCHTITMWPALWNLWLVASSVACVVLNCSMNMILILGEFEKERKIIIIMKGKES